MDQTALPHGHGEGAELARMEEGLRQVAHFQQVAEVFRQLGDPTRVRIFWLLCHCEECVINISAILEMSSPAVSHHLRPLKSSGLVVSRREGKEVYYRAADTLESRLLHQMMEAVMEITCPDQPLPPDREERGAPGEVLRPEHLETVRAIHRHLLEHLDQRVTIEELSRRYLMNPTTLKEAFKTLYGTSLAAHMKEHRMEAAGKLLRETDRSVGEIARSVGYDSQSRFAAAFKELYHVSPAAYRRREREG